MDGVGTWVKEGACPDPSPCHKFYASSKSVFKQIFFLLFWVLVPKIIHSLRGEGNPAYKCSLWLSILDLLNHTDPFITVSL